MRIVYKNGIPTVGDHNGIVLRFQKLGVSPNKYGYISETDSFTAIHSGNYLVAVFEGTFKPSIYDMNPKKERISNTTVEGVLRD